MPPFGKAAALSVAAYAIALAAGFLLDFRITLFLLLLYQVTWTPLCALRTLQLRLRGAHHLHADPLDRDAYAFALGGALSSLALFTVMLVLSQVV